jgi:hypothetical protein
MLEEHVHEESSKKKRNNFNEVQHVEDLDETSIFILSFDEVVQPCIPPAQEDEEVINSNDADKFMEQPSDTVDNHIDDFICVQKHGWDIGCFGFNGDPIYDIEGNFWSHPYEDDLS